MRQRTEPPPVLALPGRLVGLGAGRCVSRRMPIGNARSTVRFLPAHTCRSRASPFRGVTDHNAQRGRFRPDRVPPDHTPPGIRAHALTWDSLRLRAPFPTGGSAQTSLSSLVLPVSSWRTAWCRSSGFGAAREGRASDRGDRQWPRPEGITRRDGDPDTSRTVRATQWPIPQTGRAAPAPGHCEHRRFSLRPAHRRGDTERTGRAVLVESMSPHQSSHVNPRGEPASGSADSERHVRQSGRPPLQDKPGGTAQ